MPVHVYGNICDVEKIDAIAKKYNLKVIYDCGNGTTGSATIAPSIVSGNGGRSYGGDDTHSCAGGASISDATGNNDGKNGVR